MMDIETRKADILIVDDTSANLRVLSRLLTDAGYKVRPVPSGRLALEAVRAAQPDLIFLDIRMPEMDGYEVCAKLKEDELTEDIPVIFISALNDLEDKVRGFGTGAVDFISKPFQEGEVLARLETHLTICNQRRQIAKQLKGLQDLEALRENLTQMIVHDLNNPLHGILGFIQLLRIELDGVENEKIARYAASIEGIVRTTADMIRAILDVGKIESGEMQVFPEEVLIGATLRSVSGEIEPLLQEKELRLEIAEADENQTLSADPDLFRRILINIIGNAIKFSPEGGVITATVSAEPDGICIFIEDQGPGIPTEYHETIFEKYGQVDSKVSGRKYSTGLGLAFCKLAVEAHGGTIGVASVEGSGSRFTMRFPRQESPG